MHRQRLLLAFLVVPLAACASAPLEPAPQPTAVPELPEHEPQPLAAMPEFRAKLPTDSGAFYIPTSDPLHPRVHYAEGQDSLNDSCIVLTGNKLSRRVPPAFVNGRPIGFC